MSTGTGSERPRTFTESARRAQIVEAAIDTIAEVGYARASLARIGERIGISKGLIGYHFANKDELTHEVVSEIVERMKAFMTVRIVTETENGPEFLQAYIQSNLAFLQEHRNCAVAIVEIARGSTDSREQIGDIDQAAQTLERQLALFQSAGQLRPDFDPSVMALTIRAALDAVLLRLGRLPDLNVDNHARELTELFRRATSPEPPA